MNTVAVTQKTADWHSVYVKFEMVHMAAVKNINTVGRWCLMLRHGFGFCFTAGAQDSRRFFFWSYFLDHNQAVVFYRSNVVCFI